MKKIISVLLAVTVLFGTAVTGYAEDSTPDTLSEFVSDIFTEPESQTETTTFKPSTPVTTPGGYYKGDINLDCRINAADCRTILRFSSQLQMLTEQQCILADINSNNAVTAQDARLCLRMAAKMDPIIPDNDAQNADPNKYITKYDNRTQYTPYLSGFTTNITDESVFSKIRELEDYCYYNIGRVATFYYTDVNEEYFISYNSDRVYRTQCTIKAPYVKAMLDYMEEHNIPLTTVLYLQSHQKWKGHYVSGFRTGTAFTIDELMYYAIRNSDNTAYQMLFDYFGPEVLNRNSERIGSTLRLGSYIFGETSARDMAKHYLDIYHYDGIYKKDFEEDLIYTNCSPMIRRGIPDDVLMYRKLGSGGDMTVGYHDCAVVLTENPFVLIIYTSLNTDRGYDKTPFKRIAEMTYGINISMNK